MTKADLCITKTALNGQICTKECLTVSAEPDAYGDSSSHHEEFEIYWFLEGSLHFFCEGEMLNIVPGDVVILSPRLIHRRVLTKTIRYYRKHIKVSVDFFADRSALYDRLVERKIIKFSKDTAEELQLDKLLLETENGLSQKTAYDDLCASVSLLYFFTRAANYCDKGEIGHIPYSSGKTAEVIRYIDDHLSDDLDYTTIANQFYISEKNLYRIFKKETGFSLQKYVTGRRIIKAKQILNRGGTASEAATAVGYKDYSVFYRNFVHETGMTPTAFISK